jgi:hypothetical protein
MAFTEEQFKSEFSEKTEELKRKNKELESMLQGYRREHGKLEVFFEEVINAIEPIRALPKVKIDRKKSETPIEPVMQLTDLHFGAKQLASEIEGFNEYSMDVATVRLRANTQKWVDWVTYQRIPYNIRNASVLMTGDFISGDIHDELRITNEVPSPVQVAMISALVAEQIASIAPLFDELRIHFIAEDNHARLTKKPQAKEAGFNSLNYLVGKMIEAYIKDIPNVEFSLYPMLEKVVHVNSRQYLLCHGHDVKGWMGNPWYGIERKLGREAQARMQIIMQEISRAKEIGFHKYVFGHWHVPVDLPLYSCGASLSGTDSYDHHNGRHGLPGQSAWLVHPKHGEFNRINFSL